MPRVGRSSVTTPDGRATEGRCKVATTYVWDGTSVPLASRAPEAAQIAPASSLAARAGRVLLCWAVKLRLRVMSLQAMRKRLPPVVFILFLILLLVMLGIVCACISDHPAQTIDRAAGALPAGSAVIEMWSVVIVLMFASFILVRPRTLASRSSPATLQRFIF
jgi:hypothetical protein